MSHITIVEAQIVDHPDYETFVEAFAHANDALDFAIEKVTADVVDFGDDSSSVVVTTISDTQTRVSDRDGMSLYFVTRVELK